MSKCKVETMESQFKTDSIKGTVNADPSSVEYWRERYATITVDLGTAAKIHKLLSNQDALFASDKGFYKVQNLQAGTAGLSLTMKAVLILEGIVATTPVPAP